jgi:hypothetical protein
MSEELLSKLNSLRRDYDDCEDKARLNAIGRDINDITDTVRKLPGDIEEIRTRGYAFRSYLEKKAEVLAQHWDDIRIRVERAIDDERRHLRREVEDVEQAMQIADRYEDHPNKLEHVLDDLERALERFDNEVDAASSRIKDMYETLESDLRSTVAQIKEINWFLDIKDEASFPFLAGESVYVVAKAEWVETGKGRQDPDGYLFLTDQRLIFEQNEKVGKRLGLFGGKEVQEVEWEIPLHKVDSVEFENKGMFGGKDMLHFDLKSGASHGQLTVEVKGRADNKFWVKQIQRMIAGETDDERAIEPDPEMLESIRNAPTKCHVCGATLPMLVAGQNQIECEYCGSVVRL